MCFQRRTRRSQIPILRALRVSYENSDHRQKSPGPTARPLCKRGLLGDFWALVPTTAAHFHARCCTESYMNHSVVNQILLNQWINQNVSIVVYRRVVDGCALLMHYFFGRPTDLSTFPPWPSAVSRISRP